MAEETNVNFIGVVLKSSLGKVNIADQQKVDDFIRARLLFFGAIEVHFCERDDYSSLINNFMETNESPILLIDGYSPFTDFNVFTNKHVCQAIKQLTRTTFTFTGQIPGTEIISLYVPGENKPYYNNILCSSQGKYGSQLNLRKYKRLKLFLLALKKWPELIFMQVHEIMYLLKANEEFFINYGVEGALTKYTCCPHCGGTELQGLPANFAQALTGFTHTGTVVYFECVSCGLIVMNPHLQSSLFKCFYDDYDAADMFFGKEEVLEGKVRHNHEIVINQIKSLNQDCDLNETKVAIDLGGGPGLFSVALKKSLPYWNIVHGDFDIRGGGYLEDAGIELQALNLPDDAIGEQCFDIVTAFEVIEHFDYSGFKVLLRNISKALKPGGCFIFTTPDYDSPMLRAFDWFHIGHPHHPIIFRRSWLKRFFEEGVYGLKVINETGGDDFMRDRDGYFSYFSAVANNEQNKAIAELMGTILEDDNLTENLRKKFMQTEIIMTLQKR
ncbi:class I SAM-dependent methyltransferase [Kiloniella litopenaei]|uniref:class I SAM-dependent methyltransferase n=1 Tax=Kiloniella litopenaei TaxID=1549748 RepID=UPI003BA9ADFE